MRLFKLLINVGVPGSKKIIYVEPISYWETDRGRGTDDAGKTDHPGKTISPRETGYTHENNNLRETNHSYGSNRLYRGREKRRGGHAESQNSGSRVGNCIDANKSNPSGFSY